jgi:two-component system sensor histidine kinase ChiS
VKIVWVGGKDADRKTLASVLESADLGELSFATPDEAIELIHKRLVDLLLVDVLQTAADVQRLLKAAGSTNGARSGVPVLVTAPATAAGRVQACLSRGADDYLTTPFDPKNPLLVARRLSFAAQRMRSSFLSADASDRFVPREFLENLARKSIAEVRLGDHVQRDMTVFFSDIRDFTALSEQMSPQQTFEFLNSYLRHVTPTIRKYNGFVDKYIGDAIMALFPQSTDAVEAAIEVLRMINPYNAGRRRAGYGPIQIGIGIHRGDLILGTVGEGSRMQTTVIADAVNVASRIEGLTKTFRVGLLLSQAVVDDLPLDHGFNLRHLGAVKAKGKKHSVEIFECYNADHETLRDHKAATASKFDAAMANFRNGMFLSAGKEFARIASLSPEDTVSAYYRDRCSLSVVRERGPGRWEGAESIDT